MIIHSQDTGVSNAKFEARPILRLISEQLEQAIFLKDWKRVMEIQQQCEKQAASFYKGVDK